MKKQQTKSNGSVTIVVLIVIGVAFFLFEKAVRLVDSHAVLSKYNYQMAQAKLLAQSGISIAISQMENSENGKFENAKKIAEGITITQVEESSQTTPEDRLKTTYQGLLPTLNLWQNFDLKSETDKIDAEIKICVSSEDGKINFNSAFDYEENQFKPEYQEIFKDFKIDNQPEEKTLEELIKDEIESAGKKINDPTELSFTRETFPFYRPAQTEENVEKNQIEILDIFTMHGAQDGVNPLLLSSSMRKILFLEPPTESLSKKKEKLVDEICEEISFDSAKLFNQSMDKIENLYKQDETEKKPDKEKIVDKDSKKDNPEDSLNSNQDKGLRVLQSVLTRQIEPKYFSVISYARFEDVSCQLVAIFEKQASLQERYQEEDKESNLKDEKKDEEKTNLLVPSNYKIIRFYWI